MSDNDDDIFRPSTPVADSAPSDDSDITSKSKRQYSLNGSNVPAYLRDALDRFIQENPQLASSVYNRGRELPSSVEHFEALTQTLSETFVQGITDQGLRAVISLLDDMTEGAVTRRARAFDFERSIQALHFSLWVANEVYMAVTTREVPPTQDSIEFIEYLSTYIDLAIYSITDLTSQYLDSCDFAGIIPDQNIIDNGIKSYADLAYYSANGFPLASNHYLYGDVAFYRQLGDTYVSDVAKAFSFRVFTGEQIKTADEVSNTA